MIGKLVVLFILLPLIDLYLLLQIAAWIGVLETIALVVVTGIAGGILARRQGVQTMRRLQYRLERGEQPSRELADGALILLGAALLVTPGVVTDAMGFLLLLPITRPHIRGWLKRYLAGKVRAGQVDVEVRTPDFDEGDEGYNEY